MPELTLMSQSRVLKMRPRSRLQPFCLLVGTVSAALGVGLWCLHADVRAEPQDVQVQKAQESEETTRLIKAELPNWKMWIGPDRRQELTLEPKSVLRWTNPGTGRYYGDLYFWTAAGRPVGSRRPYWTPRFGHLPLCERGQCLYPRSALH